MRSQGLRERLRGRPPPPPPPLTTRRDTKVDDCVMFSVMSRRVKGMKPAPLMKQVTEMPNWSKNGFVKHYASTSFFIFLLLLLLQATWTVLWTRSPWRWSPSARVSLPLSMQHRIPALSPSRWLFTSLSISSQMVSVTHREIFQKNIEINIYSDFGGGVGTILLLFISFGFALRCHKCTSVKRPSLFYFLSLNLSIPCASIDMLEGE